MYNRVSLLDLYYSVFVSSKQVSTGIHTCSGLCSPRELFESGEHRAWSCVYPRNLHTVREVTYKQYLYPPKGAVLILTGGLEYTTHKVHLRISWILLYHRCAFKSNSFRRAVQRRMSLASLRVTRNNVALYWWRSSHHGPQTVLHAVTVMNA